MLNRSHRASRWSPQSATGAALVCLVILQVVFVVGQDLPEDIKRELNQNLAEQARIQAMRARHQQQIQARAGGGGGGANNNINQARGQQVAGGQQAKAPAHDPNNYSYQQVSPPIQYSYYQPYGDAAPQQQQPQQAQPQQQQQPINIDLNNLNFDLPTPQAQVASTGGQAQPRQQHLTPSFTGAGGLPVMQPVAATASQAPPPMDSFAPAGQAPLAPQARVQQGPPLTEADFKDITGGENYGAPGGSDFGMGGAGGGGGSQSGEPRAATDNTDAQLREFGMPDEQQQRQQPAARRQSNPLAEFGAGSGGDAGGMPDFGGFNPLGGGGGGGGQSNRRNNAGFDSDPFAGFGGAAGGGGQNRQGGGGGSMPGQSGNEFDFASQPSSARGDQAQAAMQGGAPGSLQGLLGNSFPGLGGGNGASMGLDGLARGSGGNGGSGGAPEAQLPDLGNMGGFGGADGGGGGGGANAGGQAASGRGRTDDGAMDMADLGDRSDGFSGADLGGFEQPTPQNDQDYNYAAAAEHQPKSVPYPDGAPQPVGTLWALTQPQSLSQARYDALPDKGTYQSYPAYQSGGNDFGAVAEVVDGTPRARPPGPGRYGYPSPSQLAPEHRDRAGAAPFDYGRTPSTSSDGDGDGESSFLNDAFD